MKGLGQRHRQVIRRHLGYQLPNGSDLKRLASWLADDVLPFDPQARHGRDMALDWCRTQRLEPPASDHLDRVIRSAAHRYETRQQAGIYARLSASSKAAIDRLLAGEEPDPDEARREDSATISSNHAARPGKPASRCASGQTRDPIAGARTNA